MSFAHDPRFRQVEQQFHALKAQLTTGQLTREQFEAALQKLMILDDQGRYWMMGAESGRWYVYDGQNWILRDPPSPTPPAPSAPAPADTSAAVRADAVTLAAFIPPQIPKTREPVSPDKAMTMIAFTPPQVAVPPAQTQPPLTPSASNVSPAKGTRGMSPPLVMGCLFLFVCVV